LRSGYLNQDQETKAKYIKLMDSLIEAKGEMESLRAGGIDPGSDLKMVEEIISEKLKEAGEKIQRDEDNKRGIDNPK